MGLYWDVKADVFKYKVNFGSKIEEKPITKRQLLSESARLFDPIGFLQPIIINAKMMLQELWAQRVNWDDPIEQGLTAKWYEYKKQLQYVTQIKIPRWIELNGNDNNVEIHVFADASEAAYGAVAYLKNNKHNSTHILMAKSRVAPLKKVSLARLELCAALLASQVVTKSVKILSIPNIKCFGWSDSTITLAWINKPSNAWKTFVANRVSQIQEVIPGTHWFHVKSAENPADFISRGVNSAFLNSSHLWWYGPYWLAAWKEPLNEKMTFTTGEEQADMKGLINFNAIINQENNDSVIST